MVDRPEHASMRAPDHARLYWVWQEKDETTGGMHEFALPVEDGPLRFSGFWPAMVMILLGLEVLRWLV